MYLYIYVCNKRVERDNKRERERKRRERKLEAIDSDQRKKRLLRFDLIVGEKDKWLMSSYRWACVLVGSSTFTSYSPPFVVFAFLFLKKKINKSVFFFFK